jgi:hypothetical protein
MIAAVVTIASKIRIGRKSHAMAAILSGQCAVPQSFPCKGLRTILLLILCRIAAVAMLGALSVAHAMLG